MFLQPWQIIKTECVIASSCAGERLQPIYELDTDKLTGEHSLKVKDTYDIQEFIDSFHEDADPVALFNRVRLGEIDPWNGEDTIDSRQLPTCIADIPRVIGQSVDSLTALRLRQLQDYYRNHRESEESESNVEDTGEEKENE